MLRWALMLVIIRISEADDRFRPQYHLMPAKNWLNDLNGPVYYNGYYHMFFQYNPIVPLEQDIHWVSEIEYIY